MIREILRLEHISKVSQKQRTCDISFSLRKGESLCILTEDIDTKNFLLEFLGGESVSESGNFFLRDKEVRSYSREIARLEGVCVLTENRLIGSMSVAHNLLMTDPASYGKAGFMKEKKIIVILF